MRHRFVSKLGNKLTRHQFKSNEEVVAATVIYFADLQKTYFSDGSKKLERPWVKGTELKLDYVEK